MMMKSINLFNLRDYTHKPTKIYIVFYSILQNIKPFIPFVQNFIQMIYNQTIKSEDRQKTMTTPNFYNPEQVGTLYHADISEASRAGVHANLPPANTDQERVYLLLVDVQVDFIHPDGALAIDGAVDDTRRLIQWMYQHAPKISKIGITLDSHVPIQIFHPAWWVNPQGEHPDGYTSISYQDILDGIWQPLYDVEWSKQYVEILEERAKKQLMIWPYHVLLGTVGQTLVPAVAEAVAYHSVGRKAQPNYIIKGLIPQSENYSAIEPEVKYPEHPQGDVNHALLDEMASYDKIYLGTSEKPLRARDSRFNVAPLPRRSNQQDSPINRYHVIGQAP